MKLVNKGIIMATYVAVTGAVLSTGIIIREASKIKKVLKDK